MTAARVQPGVPAGGQFAATGHAEPDVALTGPVKARGAGVWTVAETPTDVHERVRSLAAANIVHDVAQRDAVTSRLSALCRSGGTMTVLVVTDEGSVTAREGRAGPTRSGSFGMQPKGTSSEYGRVDEGCHVIDVEPGYGMQSVLAERYRSRLDEVPACGPATFGDLPSTSDGTARAAYLLRGSTSNAPGRRVFTALVTHVDEDGGAHGWVAGHGGAPSPFRLPTQAMTERAARITDYRPGTLTVAEHLQPGASTRLDTDMVEVLRAAQGRDFHVR